MTTYAYDESILDITHALIKKLENVSDTARFNSKDDFKGENLCFDGFFADDRVSQYIEDTFKDKWHVQIDYEFDDKSKNTYIQFVFKKRLMPRKVKYGFISLAVLALLFLLSMN